MNDGDSHCKRLRYLLNILGDIIGHLILSVGGFTFTSADKHDIIGKKNNGLLHTAPFKPGGAKRFHTFPGCYLLVHLPLLLLQVSFLPAKGSFPFGHLYQF